MPVLQGTLRLLVMALPFLSERALTFACMPLMPDQAHFREPECEANMLNA